MKDEPGAQFAEMAVRFEYTKAGKLVRSMLPVSHEGYCKITSFFVVGGILSILMWSDRVGFQRKPQNGSQMHIMLSLNNVRPLMETAAAEYPRTTTYTPHFYNLQV